MFKNLLLAVLASACIATAMAGPPAVKGRIDSSPHRQRGVRLTPEQVRTVEAVSGFSRKSSLPYSDAGSLRKLTEGHALFRSPLKVNSSGSRIEGWRISDEFGTMPSGWYELNLDGSEKLLWEYHDPDWVDDGWGDEPKFPFTTGFYKDDRVIGFHGEMLFNWLLWGYGSFSLDGEILEYHEYGDDLSITDFSTYVISSVYDGSRDTAYAYTLNPEGTGYMLQTVDLNAWSFEPVNRNVQIEDMCIGLAYNPQNKVIYGFTPDSRLVTLNTSTGALTTVAKLDFPATTALKGMVYSPLDKAFVFVFCDGRSDSRLYLIKPDGQATYLAELSDALQYNILVTPDEMPDDRAPGLPELTVLDFRGGSRDGSATLKMPARTFGGEDITGTLSLLTFIDGVLYKEIQAAARQTVDVDFRDVEEGQRTFSFAVKYGTLESARVERSLYVGYDTPRTPADINLTEGEISWSAVTEGEHGGYVDADGVTYNVYLNGSKINDTPVSGTSYTFTMPAEVYRKYVAQVEADNHGRLSQRGFSNDIKSGGAFPLPFAMQPTVAEGELIEVFSERGGWYEWRVSQDADNPCIYCSTSSYDGQPEDWFILPAIDIPRSDRLVEVSFDIMVDESYSDDICENISVAYGTVREPGAMTVFKTWDGIDNVGEWTTLRAWCLPAQGDTFFGFMVRTHEDGEDLKVRDIRISLSDRPATTPAEVTALSATASAGGELTARVEFRMPDRSVAGLPLDDAMLTATVASGVETVSVSGTAGSSQSAVVKTAQGWNEITVAASNWNAGLENSVKVYTGTDVPCPIDGVRISHGADYKSLHLEWDAPAGGYNGGYIDPSEVTYDLYVFDEDTYEWEFFESIGSATQYDFTPRLTGGLALVSAAVLASNEQGNCGTVYTFESTAGTPYELPMIDDFNDEERWGPIFEPCVLERPDDSYTAEWMFINGAYPYQIPEPTPYGAGAYCVFGQEGDKARVSLPVFSTVGQESVSIELPVWCGPDAAVLNVYAEAYGMAPELIGTFGDPSVGAWRKHRFHLPSKFLGKEWVSVKVEAIFSEGQSTGAFADYRIKTFPAEDFCLTALDAPSFATVGDELTVTARLENAGTRSAAMPGMVLTVYKDSEQLAALPMAPAESASSIAELEHMDFTATWQPDGNACGEVTFEVRCIAEDMDNLNNEMSAACTIASGNRPVVTDLVAEAVDGSVVLSWTEPAVERGREGFENFPAFYHADRIGDFTAIGRDGMASGYFAAFRFPFDDAPKGWQVLGEKEMTALMDEGGLENRYLHAYTGNNVIAAFTALSLTGADPASDRWLISPEVKGGSSFSFMLTSGWEGYRETVEVMYSATDDNPDSFSSLDNILLLSAGWKEYSYTLPEDARYFAIVYRSISPDGFFVMVDDIACEPVAEGFAIRGYDILRDGVTVGENVGARGCWTDTYVLPESGAVYNVVPVVEEDGRIFRGSKSNDAVAQTSGVSGIALEEVTVRGMRGLISVSGCQGLDIRVYSVDGLTAAAINDAADHEAVQLPPGVYIVAIGHRSWRVLVK